MKSLASLAIIAIIVVIGAFAPERARAEAPNAAGDHALGGKACSDADRAKVDVSAESEYWVGRAVAARLIARYVQPNRPALVFEPDSLASLYVNEVGHTVAQAAERLRDEGDDNGSRKRKHPELRRLLAARDRPSPLHGYHFILVRDAQALAFGLPGGFVVISDGMMMRAGSEEQLAGVLAHEVAHIQRGHGTELLREAICRQGSDALAQLAALKKGKGDAEKLAALLDTLVPQISQVLTDAGYATQSELEADAFATYFLKDAGYSAMGLADYLNRTGRDASHLGFSKTHPASTDRVQAIIKLLNDDKITSFARSSHEVDRDVRFVKMMVDSQLRPDWKATLDTLKKG
jgi:predicted Zn-dependent protease